MDSEKNRNVLDLKIGEEGIVKKFSDSGMACKLLTIGIIPDSRIALIRKAPFGGAYCLRLGKTFVAVRTSEAKSIIIE
jgi:ferrous iron transport protein A